MSHQELLERKEWPLDGSCSASSTGDDSSTPGLDQVSLLERELANYKDLLQGNESELDRLRERGDRDREELDLLRDQSDRERAELQEKCREMGDLCVHQDVAIQELRASAQVLLEEKDQEIQSKSRSMLELSDRRDREIQELRKAAIEWDEKLQTLKDERDFLKEEKDGHILVPAHTSAQEYYSKALDLPWVGGIARLSASAASTAATAVVERAQQRIQGKEVNCEKLREQKDTVIQSLHRELKRLREDVQRRDEEVQNLGQELTALREQMRLEVQTKEQEFQKMHDQKDCQMQTLRGKKDAEIQSVHQKLKELRDQMQLEMQSKDRYIQELSEQKEAEIQELRKGADEREQELQGLKEEKVYHILVPAFETAQQAYAATSALPLVGSVIRLGVSTASAVVTRTTPAGSCDELAERLTELLRYVDRYVLSSPLHACRKSMLAVTLPASELAQPYLAKVTSLAPLSAAHGPAPAPSYHNVDGDMCGERLTSH